MSKPRSRSSYQKSVLGCQTCKIRRVKCDETQPQCLRCVSTGRTCEGPKNRVFVVQPANRLAASTSEVMRLSRLSRPLLNNDRPREELRAFSYFVKTAAPILTGDLDITLWGTLIPQVAQSDQAVWYTLLSIANLMEDSRATPHRNGTLSTTDTHVTVEKQQALRWYAQALSKQRDRALHSGLAERLLTVFLSIVIEIQNGDFRSGLGMAQLGYSLLAPCMTHSRSVQQSLLTDKLMVMFMRNACFMSISDISVPSLRVHKSYSGADLQQNLFQYLLCVYGLIKEAFFAFKQGVHAAEFIRHKQYLLQYHLDQWLEAANHSRSNEFPVDPVEKPTESFIHSLEMYHRATVLWLDSITCPIPTTTTKDIHASTSNSSSFFLKLICQAERISTLIPTMHTTDTPTTMPTPIPIYFNDITLLPPLYFIVTLCTDTQIKDHAFKIMTHKTSQKGAEQMHNIIAMKKPTEMTTTGTGSGVRMHLAKVTWTEFEAENDCGGGSVIKKRKKKIIDDRYADTDTNIEVKVDAEIDVG